MKIEVLDKYKGIKMGLYDAHASGEPSILAEKVIDVTSVCPESPECLIKYAKDTRGMIAQINDRKQKGEDLATKLHYYINEWTPESLAADVVFERRAENMGANAIQLAKIIFENQPQNQHMKQSEKETNYKMIKEIKTRMFNNEKTSFAERNIVKIYEKRMAKKKRNEYQQLQKTK